MHIEDYKGDIGYMNSRLTGTILRWEANNFPVYVNDIFYDEGGYNELLANITISPGTIGSYNKLVPCSELNINPVRLGLVNSPDHGGVTRVFRSPNRQHKQGMWSQNIKVEDYVGMTDKNLLDTYSNKFPKIDKCFELLVNGGYKSVAFSRQFNIRGVESTKSDKGTEYVSTLDYIDVPNIGEVSYRIEDSYVGTSLMSRFDYMKEMLDIDIKGALNV